MEKMENQEQQFSRGDIVEVTVGEGADAESRLFHVLRVNQYTLRLECISTHRQYRAGKTLCERVEHREERASEEAAPWGVVESVEEIAPGIQWLTTAKHGGFRLSPEANTRIPTSLREHQGLYEEDCEWCKVVLWFPEYFAKDLCRQALVTFRMSFPVATGQFVAEREAVIETTQCGQSWGPFVAPVEAKRDQK
jgi:hypothetical protein